jgi:hypothetical protein
MAARLFRHAGLIVARDLAGGEHEVADPERFVVMGERPRCARLDRCLLNAAAGHEPDQVDLDQRVLHQQPGGADGGARRRNGEIFLPHLVEGVEIVQVGEKHLRLDDVVEG